MGQRTSSSSEGDLVTTREGGRVGRVRDCCSAVRDDYWRLGYLLVRYVFWERGRGKKLTSAWGITRRQHVVGIFSPNPSRQIHLSSLSRGRLRDEGEIAGPLYDVSEACYIHVENPAKRLRTVLVRLDVDC